MDYEFATSTNKHGVRKVDMIQIIESKPGIKIGISREKLDKLAWIGLGELDQLMEIIAIDFTSYLYVIHAMPTKKRGGDRDDKMDSLW